MDIINTNDAWPSYTSAVEINHFCSDYMYFIQTFCSLPLSCLLCWSIHILTEPMKQNVQLILEMFVVSSDFATVIDLFFFGTTAPPPPSGLGSPHSRGFLITYNDAPQSVGLLWTSDQLVAETST